MLVDLAHLLSRRMEINLHRLDYEPIHNPLVDLTRFKVGNRRKTVGAMNRKVVDATSGEIFDMQNTFGTIEEVSKEQFVQIYRAGIQQMLSLSKPGYRVFSLILDMYEEEPINHTNAWTDYVSLFVHKGLINGVALPMHPQTFTKGLKELLLKRVIAPKMPSTYWVNPHLFFKGDKFQFIKAYRIQAGSQKLTLT